MMDNITVLSIYVLYMYKQINGFLRVISRASFVRA